MAAATHTHNDPPTSLPPTSLIQPTTLSSHSCHSPTSSPDPDPNPDPPTAQGTVRFPLKCLPTTSMPQEARCAMQGSVGPMQPHHVGAHAG